ncbi:phage tail protein [Stenotrophomonas sp. GZD-301]|uniref:phage tail protein n=1 Tax=Stenotrophomonas sp. GZD-301 TaxID=3404814 RepID=UPI003BB72887
MSQASQYVRIPFSQLASACRDVVGAGGKSGSNARTPVETPDSLRSISRARILDLVSEGEIRGLVAGNQSIYLDRVPIANADGSLNFQGVRVDIRSGTQDQDYIAGFPSVENEIGVNVELRGESPVVRTASGSDLSALRIRFGVPGLQKVNTENGDTNGYSISYAIDLSTDGGAYTTVLTPAFTGKTTSQYERSHRIDLPAGSHWQVRVRRLTPNANSVTVSDTVNVLSLTEVIDAKLRYPNCALAAVEVDASQFQTPPARSYRIWGRIVRVPANYDPLTRSYATTGPGTTNGAWDGTFKSAWTNNPVWAFFDMVTNDRFGLGHRIPLDWVNKWRLYPIARYCDQLVSDGQGGMEPRFTCSLYMQTRADAYKVLQDMASMFRAISFYAAGQVMASADMPADPVFTFTQANVGKGDFSYQGSGKKVRHTVALVSWTDPDDFGRQKVEPVTYRPGVLRYGVQQTEVTAVGCDSKSQAQRIGNHILYTENLETETVSFVVGLDSLHCLPGDIIQVADSNRAGRRNGGRIKSAGTDSLVLDKVPEAIAPGDTLRATLPSGRSEARTVEQVMGNTVKVTAPWSSVPVPQSVWALESPDLALQQFRVLGIKENPINGDEGITYLVTALKHVPGKFAAIDDGTRLEQMPISIIPPSVQPPPTNVQLSSHVVIDQGIAGPVLTIQWQAADKAIAYDVEWRRDDLNWVRAGRVATSSIEIPGIYAGQYLARVRAVNALNAVSVPATSSLTAITGKTTPPPALTSLTTTSQVFAIALAWAFPVGATDTQRTEIWHGPTPDRAVATKLGDFAYPQTRHQINGLSAGARFYFWGRLVDRSGNVGPWYPAGAGVIGEASSSQTDYDTYFSGRITESALGQGLLQEISTIDSLKPLLPVLWSAQGVYSYGQTVVRDGRTYSWASPTPGNQQPPGGSWQDVGAGMAGYGALLSQVDQNTQAINVVDGKVTAQGQRITGITAQITPQGAGDGDWGAGDTNVYAGTITIQSVSANASLAQAQRTDQVEVGLGQANAAVQAETTARTTGFSALASRIDTTNASLAGTNATVQQVSQSVVALDGKVSSTYTLRAQVTAGGQIYAAGMGLGVEQQPDGSYQSQFLVRADRFAVINIANGQVTTPFVIQGGQTFISQALIGNGWITNAMIANQIASSSTNGSGLPRWEINKDGGRVVRGENFTITEHPSYGIRMRDNTTGIDFIEIGELS